MCNAWRHFIKDLGVGGGGEKKENEDDRMRSGGERDWEWRWGGGTFRGVAPDRSSCHRTSTNSAPLLQFMLRQSAKCLGCCELECLLKVCLVKVKSDVCKRFTRLKIKNVHDCLRSWRCCKSVA